MTGALSRRVARLETAAGVGRVLPVIFVRFVAPDGTEPPCDTATVNGKTWRREAGEAELRGMMHALRKEKRRLLGE
jgi:hypothetical protein